MGFEILQSDIHLNNPHAAGSPFKIDYLVSNLGPDDPGHVDHIQVWGSDGTQHVNERRDIQPTQTGGRYGVIVDIPALPAGIYDISITLPDGSAAGSSIVVE